jgi:hypothetical protein
MTFFCEKMSAENVNIKAELKPLCFMLFSSSITLFRDVFVIRYAILLRRICVITKV